MPIFTALKNNGAVLPSFREKNVADLMPGAVGDVTVVGFPAENPAMFQNAVHHLHNVIDAQLRSVTTASKARQLNVFKPYPMPYYFERPVASFSFPNATEQVKEELRGVGLTQEVARRNIWQGSPDAESLNIIFRNRPMDDRINPGTVSADGYLAYVFGIKGMGLFSYASHYGTNQKFTVVLSPAEYNEVVGDDGLATDQDIWGPGDVATRKVTFVDLHSSIDLEKALVVASDQVETIIQRMDLSRKIPDLALRNKSSMSTGGHLFPYFGGMVLPDKDYMAHVFGRIFLRCLGETEESCKSLWVRLRSGMRSLSSSRAGMALSHAYFGIELSTQLQCAISFVVDNGIYQGFVMHTTSTIYHFSTRHDAKSKEEMEVELRSLNAHEDGLLRILEHLNAPVDDEGIPRYAFSKRDIDTSRKLGNILFTYNRDYVISTSWIEDVSLLVSTLSFNETYPAVGPTTLTSFLTFVLSGDTSVLSDLPCRLGPRLVQGVDRIEFGLLIFGEQVPSLNYGPTKGLVFNVPSSFNVDNNLIEGSDGKRRLPWLPLAKVSYAQGVVQWRQLFENQVFYLPNPRAKKAEFTDSRLVAYKVMGDPSFTTVYSLVKQICDTKRGAARTSEKRKRQDDVDRKAKKAKEDDEIAEMI